MCLKVCATSTTIRMFHLKHWYLIKIPVVPEKPDGEMFWAQSRVEADPHNDQSCVLSTQA